MNCKKNISSQVLSSITVLLVIGISNVYALDTATLTGEVIRVWDGNELIDCPADSPLDGVECGETATLTLKWDETDLVDGDGTVYFGNFLNPEEGLYGMTLESGLLVIHEEPNEYPSGDFVNGILTSFDMFYTNVALPDYDPGGSTDWDIIASPNPTNEYEIIFEITDYSRNEGAGAGIDIKINLEKPTVSIVPILSLLLAD